MIDFDAINQGFSDEAQGYDNGNELNPVIRWARLLVRTVLTRYISAGSSILEINAGTGLDASWLVEHGYRVHATDIADGMLNALAKKVETFDKPEQFTFQKLSFTELEKVNYAPFDAVFSNFGGLNCVPDLEEVVSSTKEILKPGGYIVWVFMPPINPWELIQIFRGRIGTALRRLRRDGVLANVGATKIMSYYFSIQQVKKQLGSDFQITHLQSFSLFSPPMNMAGRVSEFPRLLKFLMWLDEHIGKMPIFNQCGDFLILVARYS